MRELHKTIQEANIKIPLDRSGSTGCLNYTTGVADVYDKLRALWCSIKYVVTKIWLTKRNLARFYQEQGRRETEK
jgi:hypothetical protein